MLQTEAIPHRPEADSFQFKGALDTINQAISGHKWVVIATMLMTTLLVSAYVMIWPSTFQAEVMVAVDSDKDIQRTAFYQGWNIFRKDGLNDEATLMTSPAVLREVIQRLDLKYEDVYHPFSKYAIHLWTTSWVGRHYRQFKNWVLGKSEQTGGLTPEQIEQYKVMSDFEAGVSVRQVGEANIGLVIVKGSNQRVHEIANTLIEVYLEQRRERFILEAQQAQKSLSEEAAKTQGELDQLDKEVRQFRSETGAVLLFEKDRAQIGQWLVLRAAVTDLEAQTAENEAVLHTVEAQLATEGAKLKSDRVFKEEASRDRLPKLELALAEALRSFQPDSREVREIEEQIKEAQAGLSGNQQSVVVRSANTMAATYEVLLAKKLAIESTLAGSRSALKVKKDELERMRGLLDQIPEKLQLNHEFERRQGFLENKYAGLNEKLTIASVSMATAKSAPPAMRVVEPAHTPEQAIWPQTKLLIAAALLVGAVLGVIAALLLEIMFERVTRLRLSTREGPLKLLAVVDQDEKFLLNLFPLSASAVLQDTRAHQNMGEARRLPNDD
jgi:uncharacterized protein involved in exopolysaccharide biosynthesis